MRSMCAHRLSRCLKSRTCGMNSAMHYIQCLRAHVISMCRARDVLRTWCGTASAHTCANGTQAEVPSTLMEYALYDERVLRFAYRSDDKDCSDFKRIGDARRVFQVVSACVCVLQCAGNRTSTTSDSCAVRLACAQL
jgi:hypothetical protein